MKYTTITFALLISAATIFMGCLSIAIAIGAHLVSIDLVSKELISGPARINIGEPWLLAFPIAAICLAVFTDIRSIRKEKKDLT